MILGCLSDSPVKGILSSLQSNHFRSWNHLKMTDHNMVTWMIGYRLKTLIEWKSEEEELRVYLKLVFRSGFSSLEIWGKSRTGSSLFRSVLCLFPRLPLIPVNTRRRIFGLTPEFIRIQWAMLSLMGINPLQDKSTDPITPPASTNNLVTPRRSRREIYLFTPVWAISGILYHLCSGLIEAVLFQKSAGNTPVSFLPLHDFKYDSQTMRTWVY